MCESNAYIVRDGKEELVFKDVASLEPQGENLLLKGVLGDATEVKARLIKMDFMEHKILLEEIK
jgi:predicted RNA-binding protein